MNVTIEVDASHAIARLEEWISKIAEAESVIEPHFTSGVEAMVALAQYYCPKGATGNLATSIHYEGSYPDYVLVADAVNKYGQPYAAYVEYGTSKMMPQPFMWPAVYGVLPDMKATIMHSVRRFFLA